MPEFENAVLDYRFFRNRGYPDRGALKLVGDRYRLNAVERNCLFRGVVPEAVAAGRRRKLVAAEALRGRLLGIDWFNVLITVESYLKGLPMFVSDDGIVRDASGVHGSYRPTQVTGPARQKILDALDGLAPARVEIFLDSPIPHSGRMAEELREELDRRAGFSQEVSVIASADYALKNLPGVVASGDSIVMDAARWVFDLPRHALQRGFGRDFEPLPGAPAAVSGPLRAEAAPPPPEWPG